MKLYQYEVVANGVVAAVKGTMNEAVQSALTNASFTDFDAGTDAAGQPCEALLQIFRTEVGGSGVRVTVACIDPQGFRTIFTEADMLEARR